MLYGHLVSDILTSSGLCLGPLAAISAYDIMAEWWSSGVSKDFERANDKNQKQ